MSDENPSDSGRKSARAKQARKRDEDVLDQNGDDGAGDEIKKPDKTATARDTDTSDASEEEAADKTKPQPVNPVGQGETWLGELFERMKLDLDVDGGHHDQNLVFNISGTDADDLIGRSRRSPRLLSAMQVLLKEHLGENAADKNVLIDVGGFKKKRQKQLTGVADELGETVRRIDRGLIVAGLDKYERRIIHQRLENVDGVKTDSVGHGTFRKLRILTD